MGMFDPILIRQNFQSDDYTRFHDKVRQLNFARLGKIAKLYTDNLRADVTLFRLNADKSEYTIKGVELVNVGTASMYVEIEPQVGDIVLCFAFRDFAEELDFDHKATVPHTAVSYSDVTIKAVLVQPNSTKDNTKAKAKFTCNKDGEFSLDVNSKTKVDVDADGNVSIKAQKFTVNDGHFEVT